MWQKQEPIVLSIVWQVRMLSSIKGFWRYLPFLILICSNQIAHAHQPDLSSLMIYQQQEKYFLVIKSALSAFESEITYLYPKAAYKTPQEFQELVIQHFQKKCHVVINSDTIRFSNPQVNLGHETTLIAEIVDMPHKVESLYIQNMIFGDISNSICEVILTIHDIAQKQFLLKDDNNREAHLTVENGHWTMKDNDHPLFTKSALIILKYIYRYFISACGLGDL
jgi:hypothetical protein